ncbi:TPR-like protein [Irpex rosettiformis]|uniref:TPR-like protein n=1 Tax=Irpex rosettiformis TaxID=378272 RepID=A0ACB8UGA9_9APHY|nr:TPR-like protein [Irpex rosettiformis]
MSAIAKTKLKAAREAIAKKDYIKAKDASLSALDCEPENYLAHVLLCSAYLELGDLVQSEQICLKATEIQPDVPTAWLGLAKVYERNQNWERYIEVLDKLAKLFLKSNDATKCAETLQKLIEYRRTNGTPMEAYALTLLLPESGYYHLLSELPPPDATNPSATTTFDAQSAIHNSLPILEEIISIIETHENDVFQKEVAKRRTRLGAAGPEAVKREVGREVWGISRLPLLYQEILGHPNASDDLRRATEAKLLQYKQQLLYALTSKDDIETKKKLSEELKELIDGIVLLNIPNALAWNLHIEGINASSIEEYDLDVLFRYVRLFPTSPLAKLLSAYFAYSHIPDTGSDEEKTDKRHEDEDTDLAAVILGLFPHIPNSIVAHRIAAQVYQDEEHLENAVRTAENGLELVLREERNRAITLSRVRLGLNVILGTALVHLFPPKHHTRALRIIDEVLSEESQNVPCLMGRGFIFQHAKRWVDARAQFTVVASLIPDDVHDGLRSREEAAWCQAQDQDPYGASQELLELLNILDAQQGREYDKARCWWRLGKCQWDLGDKASREDAYKSFIISLKRFSAYAPAFTSLGIYYSDFCTPPDPTRASKCFQKAFELDAREAEAARRLAEGFAEERDWDLVEVVARRTIEGEGGMDGGLDSLSKFQPLNAWAWKALGIVELTRHRYSAAISALQVALRSQPEDPLLWLRLGEAYTKATRLAAALKALEKSRELDPSEWKCSYFLGEVYRQSGQYQQAIDMFSMILLEVPSELTVLLSLAQTHLDFGKAENLGNFSARAESSFVSAIRVVLDGFDASPGFRRIAWKTAADALYELSQLPTYTDDETLLVILKEALPLIIGHPMERLSTLLEIPPKLSETSYSALSRFVLEVSLCAYSYRISLGSLDSSASASAWYDLAVALKLYGQRNIGDEKREKVNDEAVQCFKEAISLSPIDDRYWNALANALFISKPRLAQHAYVKALDIDTKNFVTWTNLGLFYLYHSDAELAREAFNRAQVLDPDYALAWVGQAVLAVTLGHRSEASALFEHAVGLTTIVPEADIAYARRSFQAFNSVSQKHPTPLESFFPAFFVLGRYSQKRPDDATGLHLFGLVCERVGHLNLGITCIEKAVSLLEAAYEESEDPVLERQYTIAHINMARLRLSSTSYEEALDSYRTVIGLLGEPEDLSSCSLLAQAHLGSGLVHLKLGDAEAAIEAFETALEAAANDLPLKGNAVVLLAQTLWSLDTEEAREAAKAHLLQSIESDPDNLIAVNTLAGMGIFTEDDSLLDAALSEILSLPIHERHERDPEREVSYLLIQHHLSQSNVREAVAVAQSAVVHEPARSEGREELACLAMQQGEAVSAHAILQSSSIESRNTLGLRAIMEARLGISSAKSSAAKAVFRTPWEQRNWQALAYCRSMQH